MAHPSLPPPCAQEFSHSLRPDTPFAHSWPHPLCSLTQCVLMRSTTDTPVAPPHHGSLGITARCGSASQLLSGTAEGVSFSISIIGLTPCTAQLLFGRVSERSAKSGILLHPTLGLSMDQPLGCNLVPLGEQVPFLGCCCAVDLEISLSSCKIGL